MHNHHHHHHHHHTHPRPSISPHEANSPNSPELALRNPVPVLLPENPVSLPVATGQKRTLIQSWCSSLTATKVIQSHPKSSKVIWPTDRFGENLQDWPTDHGQMTGILKVPQKVQRISRHLHLGCLHLCRTLQLLKDPFVNLRNSEMTSTFLKCIQISGKYHQISGNWHYKMILFGSFQGSGSRFLHIWHTESRRHLLFPLSMNMAPRIM